MPKLLGPPVFALSVSVIVALASVEEAHKLEE